MSEGPPFFIVGSARSGTTLLRMMLNAHPDVSVPPESRFVVELYRGHDVVEVERTLAELEAHPRFRLWELPIEAVRKELEGGPELPYAEVMAAAYRAYARAAGKVRWGDKTPRYVEDIPLLARLWPQARFVHLVRDGRNVALSYADVPFGPKTVGGAAQLWAERVAIGVRDGRALGPERYRELHYESLVEDPEAEMQALCAFLDLRFDAAVLSYTEQARIQALERSKLYNPHVVQPPLKHVRSWEHHMPSAQVEIFEAVAGDVLGALGYPRRYEHPSLRARLAGFLGCHGMPVGRLRGRGRASEPGPELPSIEEQG